MSINQRCEWVQVQARTPSGKVRMIHQCTKCKRVKYRQHGETRYVSQDGRLHAARTVDESWCEGK